MTNSFYRLVSLMTRLRSREGCPWDRVQTFGTLGPMLIEEAWEVADAAEHADPHNVIELREELGDLLFLIVFFAQLASEQLGFSIDDIAEGVHAKLVRRHPHVFGEASAGDADQVLKNWDQIKAEERRAKQEADSGAHTSLLSAVPAKMPALMEAERLSKKAATTGFDWQSLEDIFDKVDEEINELREAIELKKADASGSANERILEEVGDLLFAVTNVARHLKVDPEAALKRTNRKFRKRFAFIEESFTSRGEEISGHSIEELEDLWQASKRIESQSEN